MVHIRGKGWGGQSRVSEGEVREGIREAAKL